MCDCTSNPCGCDNGISLPYLTGPAGLNGIFGGFSAKWKYDSSSILDNPPTTYLRFNDANPGIATNIYINNNNDDSINHSAFLNSFNNDGNYGLLRIFKEYDSSIFAFYKITNIVSTGTSYSLSVTPILFNGTFTLNDKLVVSFAASGDTGAAGADGADGVSAGGVIDIVYGTEVLAAQPSQVLGEIEVPANTLSALNDIIEFSATIWVKGTVPPGDTFNISFGNQGYALNNSESFFEYNIKNLSTTRVNGKIYYKTETTAQVVLEFQNGQAPLPLPAVVITDIIPEEGVLHGTQIYKDFNVDFSEINKFQVYVDGPTSNRLELTDLMVKFTKSI